MTLLHILLSLYLLWCATHHTVADTPIFSDDHETTAKRAVWQALAEAEMLAQVNTHREQSSSAQW